MVYQLTFPGVHFQVSARKWLNMWEEYFCPYISENNYFIPSCLIDNLVRPKILDFKLFSLRILKTFIHFVLVFSVANGNPMSFLKIDLSWRFLLYFFNDFSDFEFFVAFNSRNPCLLEKENSLVLFLW